METRTCFLIKPEAVRSGRFPEILRVVLSKGFTVERLEMRTLSRELAERFYEEHRGKGFYEELVTYMTGGPILALRLRAENAVRGMRELAGATNPTNASPGTLRAEFGTSLQENAVHASALDTDAERELGLLFPS